MKPASPIGLANLGPLAQLKAGRLPERVLRLLAGLWLYGLAIALMIEGAVGASPWDVFHLGVSRHLPLSFGTVMILAAVAVLLAWIPLRQMPGLGTLANTLLLGPFADLNLAWLATPEGLPLRCAYLLAGVVLCAVATALYIGAQLGPGPRVAAGTRFPNSPRPRRCAAWRRRTGRAHPIRCRRDCRRSGRW